MAREMSRVVKEKYKSREKMKRIGGIVLLCYYNILIMIITKGTQYCTDWDINAHFGVTKQENDESRAF